MAGEGQQRVSWRSASGIQELATKGVVKRSLTGLIVLSIRLPGGTRPWRRCLSSSAAGEHDDGHVLVGAGGIPERLFDDVEFSYLVVVAAELGVADLFAAGPLSLADLSEAAGVDSQSLYRVLRALASRELFREDDGRRFSLTPLAEPLQADAAHSVRPDALWIGSEAYRRTWGDLSYSVRTGQPPFDHVYGKPFFDYLAEQPALARIFNDVMTSASSDEGAAIAAAYDFSVHRRIVDVGGGHSALLAAVLDRY